ncbi:hypothetical protein CKAH01_01821 [Colletotrichum kahawae]|uniref:C3H1-type domain-containing protein n=1 Tax=Colletotrichum kahawae TaxID=34407 RepID=A0AAD9Y555_COLKA|nr:hypothetical protein CKAH01_01821 [Colletotrichum kahawae]
MEALTRDLDGKLKLEDVPESDSMPHSDPVPQRPDTGRPYQFSGLDAEVVPEGGDAASKGPNGEASQRFDAMEALTKEMDSKLKLEGGVTAYSEGPEPHGEASSIPENEANSSPQKPRQTFAFTFDEGNLRTAAGPERSAGDKALNPSAPVWIPSPSMTKEHPLPLRLREGPKLPTDAGDDTLKNDIDLQRYIGNEGQIGTETQIKATSSDPRVVNAKEDRKSQIPCRNMLIYGHCRYEDLGCGFKHC